MPNPSKLLWWLFVPILCVLLLKDFPVIPDWRAYCGADQDGPVCLQQWLAALGPTVALLFAAAGALQLRTQIAQGQSATISNQRTQLRHEFETLADVRDNLLKEQKLIEEYELLYTPRLLPANTTWHELEKVQRRLDGFVEWVDNNIREPYLREHSQLLGYIRSKAAIRAERFRLAADRWCKQKLSDATMARTASLSIRLTIREIAWLRSFIDQLSIGIADRVATLASRPAATLASKSFDELQSTLTLRFAMRARQLSKTGVIKVLPRGATILHGRQAKQRVKRNGT